MADLPFEQANIAIHETPVFQRGFMPKKEFFSFGDIRDVETVNLTRGRSDTCDRLFKRPDLH